MGYRTRGLEEGEAFRPLLSNAQRGLAVDEELGEEKLQDEDKEEEGYREDASERQRSPR